jgi:hypothetical protein
MSETAQVIRQFDVDLTYEYETFIADEAGHIWVYLTIYINMWLDTETEELQFWPDKYSVQLEGSEVVATFKCFGTYADNEGSVKTHLIQKIVDRFMNNGNTIDNFLDRDEFAGKQAQIAHERRIEEAMFMRDRY